ncbi:MAG: DUF3570 domain-containing protein [Gammaproteobacteria bacterium]
MQLTPKTQRKMALAVTALLGVNAAKQVHAEESEWQFDSSVFSYMESDNRVTDLSVRLEAQRTTESEKIFALGLSVDSLSGASPNGAIATHTPQTVTSPSGNSQVYASELPMNRFYDRRFAGQVSYQLPVGALSRLTTGLTFSQEDDYQHAGLNLSFARDFFQRNTTLNAGVAFSSDSVKPVDGIPNALSNVDLGQKRSTNEDKAVTDLLLGVTQVLSPKALLQLNYGYSDASGYLNDPYKLISQVNGLGTVESNIYENRPEARLGHNLYGALKLDNRGDVTTLSYRFHTDDWGIDSNTFDLRYRFSLGASQHYIEPHVRYYAQSAADFYRLQLTPNDNVPAHVSADYRLAAFSAITLGFRYGISGPWGSDWRLNFDYYTQNPSDNSSEFADQQGLNLNPGVSAIILSLGARF